MVTIAYTNISPISITNNNINHFFYIKKEFNPKKLYVCIWDNFVFEDERFFSKNFDNDKATKLKENVEIIEKIMNYLEMDYKIIYLSEAWDRLFKRNEFSLQFQKILSRITVGNMINSRIKNIILEEIKISKINYIIADYLIASNLEELYPELCSSPVNEYISIYMKLFEDAAKEVIKEKINKKLPKVSAVNNAPMMLHKKDGIMPSLGMSINEIKRIVKSNFGAKGIEYKTVFDLLDSFNFLVKDKDFLDMNSKRIDIEDLKKRISNSVYDKECLENIIINNLKNYFDKTEEIVKKAHVNKENKNIYLDNLESFKDYFKELNPLKLKIMRYCDGTNSSLDISRKSGIKLSTVSTYLTKLKVLGIISNERKPKRKVNNIVINFDTFE